MTAQQIDRAVRLVAERAYQQAAAVLDQNRSLLEEAAGELLAKESLDEADLQRLFAHLEPPADAAAAPTVLSTPPA